MDEEEGDGQSLNPTIEIETDPQNTEFNLDYLAESEGFTKFSRRIPSSMIAIRKVESKIKYTF